MAIARPVVLPFMDAPVVVLLAAGPPACELPPAVPPDVCATASVPLSANAPASRIVLSFIECFLRFMAPKEMPSARFKFHAGRPPRIGHPRRCAVDIGWRRAG